MAKREFFILLSILAVLVAVVLVLNPKKNTFPNASSMPTGIALGIYEPSYPNDLTSVNSYESAAGTKVSIIHWFAIWGGWKSACSLTDMNIVKNRGSLPMITWEPWDGTNNSSNDPNWNLKNKILSGASDTYIDSWASCIKNYGSPVLLRFAHEMNNQPTYPWSVGHNGNLAADYINAWRYVWNRFAAKGVTNVRWVWNPNTMWGTAIPTYESIYSSIYPGDTYVDWLGLDLYNTAGLLSWGPTSWTELSQLILSPYGAITAIAPNKPVVLAEVSSGERSGYDKGNWINSGFGSVLSASYPAIHALVWFDVNKELDWRINSSTSSHNAFVNIMKLPQYSIDVNSFLGLTSNPTPVATTITPTVSGLALDTSAISVTNITTTTATISWNTTNAEMSQIIYGLKVNSLTNTFGFESSFTNAHNMTLTNLSSSKTYYYQVVSKDQNGKTYTSTINSFRTPKH